MMRVTGLAEDNLTEIITISNKILQNWLSDAHPAVAQDKWYAGKLEASGLIIPAGYMLI